MKMSRKVLITTGSLIASFVVIGLGLWVASGSLDGTYTPEKPGTQAVTQDLLAIMDGKAGHKCWLAVDSTVYQISASPNWIEGQHNNSDGLAYCGADMSKVIDQAPHGRRILNQLTIIGKLR